MASALRFANLRKVLVVAPHPDDESLGCGGLIAKLAAKGATFHTVFITDGGASHSGSRKWPRQRLAARREHEAEQALRLLGIGDQPRTFLRLHDADMPAAPSAEWAAALARLEAILREFRPDLVLVPWRRDPHCDHRKSWQLTTDAICQYGGRLMRLEYAIWLEEYGVAGDFPREHEVESIAVDVSSERGRKRAAIAAHLSQTSELIDDDPSGFRLSPETIARLTGPYERYWRVVDETH